VRHVDSVLSRARILRIRALPASLPRPAHRGPTTKRQSEMSSKTPLIDVKAQYERLIPDILERMREVLDSGVFILGPNVQAFEREAASYLGVPRTVGVANGTDGLVLALDALGVGPGDEVICPAFTFYATAESIARRGATPVFADIDPGTLNLDPEDVAAKVTERTRALMPVHLFGRVMPLGELAKLDVPIIEDAAQAFGAEGVATTGVLSTFSFFPTKNLFALGDGGSSPPPMRNSRTASPFCASTARARRRSSRRLATTRGSTSSRRRC